MQQISMATHTGDDGYDQADQAICEALHLERQQN